MEMEAVKLTGAKILVVDDSTDNINILDSILSNRGYRVFAAKSGETAIEIAKRTHPHLILMDIMMPGIDGFETCRALRELSETKDIPVIFITAKSTPDDICEGFAMGGVDYINKPINYQEVLARVENHLRSGILIENQKALLRELNEKNKQLEKANYTLEQACVTDHLTGLRNRRFLYSVTEKDAYLVLREYRKWTDGSQVAEPTLSDINFFLFDIDHFKDVNDKYGHATGDKVLAQVSTLFEPILRRSDYLVRWGGEEFLLVSRFQERQQAKLVAERILEAFSEYCFDIGDGQPLKLTCSIGFASYPFLKTEPETISWSQCIALADKGLYAAKNASRNAWVGLDFTGDCSDTYTYEFIKENINQFIASGDLQVLSSLEAHKPLSF